MYLAFLDRMTLVWFVQSTHCRDGEYLVSLFVAVVFLAAERPAVITSFSSLIFIQCIRVASPQVIVNGKEKNRPTGAHSLVWKN